MSCPPENIPIFTNPLLHNNALWKPLKYHVFENIMENGVFILLEQMLHFS